MGQTCTDFLAVPLCRACHEQVTRSYTLGNLSREATVHLITAVQAQLLSQWCAAVQQQAAFNWFVNAQAPAHGPARWVLAAADDGTRLLSLPGNPTMRVLHRGMAVELAGATESPPLLGRITELYFEGDFGASVGNCGQVSARIAEILPVATIVEETWRGAQAALDAGLARLR